MLAKLKSLKISSSSFDRLSIAMTFYVICYFYVSLSALHRFPPRRYVRARLFFSFCDRVYNCSFCVIFREYLSEEKTKEEPLAGSVFKITNLSCKGKRANEYDG